MTTKDRWLKEMGEIFGLGFLLERKLESTFDKVLEPYNLTVKQWLVLAVIENAFKESPSIQEVARELNTSHQNIKAIALNLERRGFIMLAADSRDRRVTRIATTKKSKEFWQTREDEDKRLIAELFKYLTNEEVVTLHQLLGQLIQGAGELSERITNEIKEKRDEVTRVDR